MRFDTRAGCRNALVIRPSPGFTRGGGPYLGRGALDTAEVTEPRDQRHVRVPAAARSRVKTVPEERYFQVNHNKGTINVNQNLFHPRSRHVSLAAVLMAGVSLLPLSVQAQTPTDTLVMAWNIDVISTFDPAQVGEAVTFELLANTCDTLVAFDPADEREIIPGFAESWEVSEDGMEITFHLRQGVTFPSGNPVTAQDAAWSLHRVVHLGFGNAATLTEYGFTADAIEEQIVAVDDYTLVWHLDRPYPVDLVMQAVAAHTVATPLDSVLIMENEVDGDYGNDFLMTRTECVGPYQLARWDASEAVILEVNEDYWGEMPPLSRIFIRHVAEPGTQRLLLEQGDVDVARNLGPDDLIDLEDATGVTVALTLRPQLFFWSFNLENEYFAIPEVRLAMRYLIDYEGLGETVMATLGVPRASFVPLGSVGALDEEEGQPFSLDLERARELLAEAGLPDGFDAEVIYGSGAHTPVIAQNVQQNAAQVGINLSLQSMSSAQYASRLRAREYDSGMGGWLAMVPDAHANASRFAFNPDNSREAQLTQYPSWRAAFYDEDLNARVDAALLEPDPDVRNQMYADLQRDMMEIGPVAFMFQMYNIAGVSDAVQDWTWHGLRTYYNLASK